MFTIELDGQQDVQDFRARVQVVDRLEQGRYIERYLSPAIVQLAPLCEQQHGQNIVRRPASC